MKKFFSFLIALVVGCIAYTAQATNITFTVNRSDAVYISYYDNASGENLSYDLKEGSQTYDISQYSYVYIRNKDGYLITAVSANGVYPDKSAYYWYFSVYTTDDCSVDITALTEEEAYTDVVSVKVDDPEAVSMRFGGSYRTVTITEANVETDVKFNAASETSLMVMSATYGKSLYKVLLNGVEQTEGYSGYELPIVNGDKVEVISAFPDVDCHVSFTYGEGAEGFITGVTVDNEAISDFQNGFTAKLGSTVTISGDTQNYKFDSMTINGQPLSYFYGSTSFTLTEDTEIVVNAHKYGTLKVNLNIDNPDNITAYRGYSYYQDIIALQAGDNEVEISENNATITVSPKSGCYIKSILDVDKNEELYNGSSNTYLSVTDGMNIQITTGAIVRDQKFVLYIDDKDAAEYNFYISRYDRSYLDVVNGYSTVYFYDGDNSFTYGWYGALYNNLYINDIKQSPPYEDGTYYYATMADGDVAKVFIASDPEFYGVTFDVPESIAQSVTVTKDLIKEVSDYQNGFTALPGTAVVIAGDEIKVSVNDVELTANDGKFEFTIDAAKAVKIESTESGVESVAVSASKADNAVYNLQGVKLFDNASQAQIKNLPAGIYIVNGKKFINK